MTQPHQLNHDMAEEQATERRQSQEELPVSYESHDTDREQYQRDLHEALYKHNKVFNQSFENTPKGISQFSEATDFDLTDHGELKQYLQTLELISKGSETVHMALTVEFTNELVDTPS